jgi:cytochrome c-type biogenesis protein CcmH
MLQRKSRLLLVLALAAICLPQTATQYVTSDVRRVGDKLASKCGACNNTVGTCPMLECHYSLPAREKIGEMQKAGASDQTIVDAFVKESGLSALASPPAEGFNLLGWVMPFVGLAFGLAMVTLWFKRFMRRKSASAPGLPDIDRRYQERMDKELEELE